MQIRAVSPVEFKTENSTAKALLNIFGELEEEII